MKLTIISVLVGLLAAHLYAQAGPESRQQEEKLLAVLKSDASQQDKADACRQLAVVGSRMSVGPLAALLDDEKLSHMARYALEPIPDPAVDDALREALGRVRGRLLVGVIGSIGVRRDARAVDRLSGFLKDADPEVAQAAARALGKIGTLEAARAIEAVLEGAPAHNQLAFCEGLLRCAEAMAQRDQLKEAVAAYDRLLSLRTAHQVRTAAVRGSLLLRGQEGLPLLRQYLGSEDYGLFAAAVRSTHEWPGSFVTAALTADLGKQAPDRQILMVQALGSRRDATALPVLIAGAKEWTKTVRLAAIRALGEIGDAKAVPALADLMLDADREIAQAAQESLASFPGPEADAAVLALLTSGQVERRLTGMELIGRRRMTSYVPDLLKAAGEPDAKVREAAVRQLRELAGTRDLPAMLDLLLRTDEPRSLQSLEQAIAAVCARAEDPETCAATVRGRLNQGKPAQRVAILHILGAVGGNTALEAVRSAGRDAEELVREAAVRAITEWPDASAIGDMMQIVKSGSETQRILALRGLVGVIQKTNQPAGQALELYKQMLQLCTRAEEKRLVLAGLGELKEAGALEPVVGLLGDEGLRNEAGAALLRIARAVGPGRPAVRSALQKLLESQVEENLKRRAQDMLR